MVVVMGAEAAALRALGTGLAVGAYAGSGYYGDYGYGPYAYGDDSYGYGDYAYGGYDNSYADNSYAYDSGYNGAYAAAPVVTSDDNDDASCAQQLRSYDPRSGTYLGYDGMRHPCP